MSRIMRKTTFSFAKKKRRSATQMIQFLSFLNPKFPAITSSHLLCLLSSAGVGPVRKSNRWFTHATQMSVSLLEKVNHDYIFNTTSFSLHIICIFTSYLTLSLGKHVREINIPLVKLGNAGVKLFFLIFAPKHRLWVLVRTASPRRFLRVPTIYVLSENKKNINTFY